jgi:hypothetical protein
MKQMKKVILALLVAPLAFTACKKSDSTTPAQSTPITVSVTPSNTTSANPGDKITFVVAINSTNTLKDITITQDLGGNVTQVAHNTITSGTTASIQQDYIVPPTSGTVKVNFVVTDTKGNSQTATATITVSGSSTDFNVYNALLGNYKESAGSFFGAGNGTTYNVTTASSNQSNVDLVFFYGSSNGATLAAPNDASFGTGSGQISEYGIQNWSTKNATTFRTTTADFSSIKSSADIANAYNNGTDFSPNTRANHLSVSSVIAFKTASGKMGVAEVTSLNGADANGNGTMGLALKVQK